MTSKITVYGLPLNPISLLDTLAGTPRLSFCVSYATREKLGRQLDQGNRLGAGLLRRRLTGGAGGKNSIKRP